jgi:tRNA1(Val) A37 N6-methylase TrmN6
LKPLDDSETLDGVFRNKVRVIQARKGYRVSEDALLLAWFTRVRDHDLALDAGTGNGVIAFGLARINKTVNCVGLEIQSDPAFRAKRGTLINNLDDRVFIVRGDLRQADSFFRPMIFDVVVSNPPYHEYGRGRINELSEKALSRHQIMMPLTDLFRISSCLVKDGGHLSLIYPASGVDLIRRTASDTGFKMSRVLWIYPRVNVNPSLICVEAKKTEAKVKLTESRIELYGSDGTRTPKADSILSGSEIVV